MIAVVLAGSMGLVTNLVPMARDQGIDAGRAALLLSIFAVCSLAAKLSFAALADRLNLRHLTLLCVGGSTLGMASLIHPDSGYAMLVTGMIVLGLLGGFMVPLQGMLVPRMFGPRVVGKVLGLLNLVIMPVLLETPPVFGLIFDQTGSYAIAIAIYTALGACMLLLVPYVRLHPPTMAATGAANLGLNAAGRSHRRVGGLHVGCASTPTVGRWRCCVWPRWCSPAGTGCARIRSTTPARR